MTPEEYFKKWAENCRIFTDYKPIHDHNDMMQFAKDYHAEQLRLHRVSNSSIVLHNCSCDKPDPVEVKMCLECDGITHQ